MTRLAAAAEPWLAASDAEIVRGGASYTVDTLDAIHASDPSRELTLILGADMARTLPAWREPDRLLSLARVAVAERDGTAQREICDALGRLGGVERLEFLDMAPMPVSSSLVRERVSAGHPVDDLVPAAVADYIASHGLYRSHSAAARADSRVFTR